MMFCTRKKWGKIQDLIQVPLLCIMNNLTGFWSGKGFKAGKTWSGAKCWKMLHARYVLQRMKQLRTSCSNVSSPNLFGQPCTSTCLRLWLLQSSLSWYHHSTYLQATSIPSSCCVAGNYGSAATTPCSDNSLILWVLSCGRLAMMHAHGGVDSRKKTCTLVCPGALSLNPQCKL